LTETGLRKFNNVADPYQHIKHTNTPFQPNKK
jgi:hypothetical protein